MAKLSNDTDKHYCQHLETLGLGDDLSHLKWRHFTIMSVLAGDCVRLQNRINNDLTDMVKESPRLENTLIWNRSVQQPRTSDVVLTIAPGATRAPWPASRWLAVDFDDGGIDHRVFHIGIIRDGVEQTLETPALVQSRKRVNVLFDECGGRYCDRYRCLFLRP